MLSFFVANEAMHGATLCDFVSLVCLYVCSSCALNKVIAAILFPIYISIKIENSQAKEIRLFLVDRLRSAKGVLSLSLSPCVLFAKRNDS